MAFCLVGPHPPEVEGGEVDLFLLNLDRIKMLTTSELRVLAAARLLTSRRCSLPEPSYGFRAGETPWH